MKNGISWIGAMLVAAILLKKSKAGQEGDESYENKITRDNFVGRAKSVKDALNRTGGDYKLAAEYLKNCCEFFTDVSDEQLSHYLEEAIKELSTIELSILPKETFGDLDFKVAMIQNEEDEVDEISEENYADQDDDEEEE